jgi:hypothetical protein
MRILNSTLLWILAFVLTASSAVYQRLTGPSYPIRGAITLADHSIDYKLPRSHGEPSDAPVRIALPTDTPLTGVLEYRRFRSDDPWHYQPLQRAGDFLVGKLPQLPPAGKVMYSIVLRDASGTPVSLTETPVILRFRGHVPEWILITHIITIFGGMLCSLRAGFEALRKDRPTRALTIWTLALLVVGGLIFGPIVQKYAFGAYWTGWPFGHDLTDNKIAVAVIFWLIALFRHDKRRMARGWVLTASIVTLGVWLIPHSVLGSELDFTAMDAPPLETQPTTMPLTQPASGPA